MLRPELPYKEGVIRHHRKTGDVKPLVRIGIRHRAFTDPVRTAGFARSQVRARIHRRKRIARAQAAGSGKLPPAQNEVMRRGLPRIAGREHVPDIPIRAPAVATQAHRVLHSADAPRRRPAELRGVVNRLAVDS